MMATRYRHSKYWAAVAFIFICPLIVGLVSSQSMAEQKSATLKGLTVSPLRRELELAPGTSQGGVLTVTNSSDKPMRVFFSAEEFSVIGQQYDYAFTVESNIAKWASFSTPDITLYPRERETVRFTIGAPLSAEPGGRYISLFASANTDPSESGVMSRQRVASLFYINVSGEVTRSGHFVSLSSPWVVSGKSDWGVVIRNTGTTHFRSRYNVKLHNIVGNSQAGSMSGDALILPSTVRLVNDSLPIPKLPGIYKITYTIGLGDTPAKEEIRYMVYTPPLFVAFFVAIIVVYGIWLFRLRAQKR